MSNRQKHVEIDLKKSKIKVGHRETPVLPYDTKELITSTLQRILKVR